MSIAAQLEIPGFYAKTAITVLHVRVDWCGSRRTDHTVLSVACSCSVKDTVQFSSSYALGKAHMRSTPSLILFPNVAFETVPLFV